MIVCSGCHYVIRYNPLHPLHIYCECFRIGVIYTDLSFIVHISPFLLFNGSSGKCCNCVQSSSEFLGTIELWLYTFAV